MSFGVVGVIAVGLISAQVQTQNTSLVIQTMAARNLLQIQLQQSLINPGAVNQTLLDTSAGNVALKNCLRHSGNSCVQITDNGFYLLDPSGSRVSGSGSSAALLYDYTGAQCAVASSQCLFQVFTTYTARCPGATPCSNPTVTAKYTIQQAPGITPAGGIPLKKLTSQTIVINDSGSGGAGIIGGTCGPNEIVSQIKPNGTVSCTSVSQIPGAPCSRNGYGGILILRPNGFCCLTLNAYYPWWGYAECRP